MELGIGSLTEKVEETRILKRKGEGASWFLTMVEEGAGFLTEVRRGGLKQVDVRILAPHRYKRRKLVAEKEKGTALSRIA